jgi:hypothetical protein
MHTISSQSLLADLRLLTYPAALSGLLPLPALLIANSPATADLSSLYLGLASAWLASEAFHPLRFPCNAAAWRTRITALGILLSANVALFAFLGANSEIQSHIPFPLMAVLSAIPALGIVPWLTLKMRQQYQAIVLSALAVGGAKIAGCIVARIVYGPNALHDGFMAADWRTAPLMISCFWAGTVLISVGGLLRSHRLCARQTISNAF